MSINVTGELSRHVAFTPAQLAELPRREMTADLHCVAGWSAGPLIWEGVAFQDVYRLLISPALAEGARVRYVVFVGLDGFRSIVTLHDALAANVLLADRLDHEALSADHGAPVRLVSPDQYAFVSTKHLCRIELYRSEPAGFYHSTRSIQRALLLVRPHRRARVWQQERHRYAPAWLVRLITRAVIKVPTSPGPVTRLDPRERGDLPGG